jgi:hypothetical protein
MSIVVDFVKDVVDFAVDTVSNVVEFVGDVVESAVEIVSDAASWIDDNVIQPLLDDPIGTIATIAAVATGNTWAVPYINAANTAVKGGDLGDIALSFGASYVGGKAGDYVGKTVSQSLSTVAVDAAGNVVYTPTLTSKIASSTAAGATRGGVSAGIRGDDIGEGALAGAASGAAGAIGREAGQFVFEETDSKLAADVARGVTAGGVSAGLTGRDVGVGAIMGGADAALNTAINFGSEYIFGDKKDQEDWQKATTSLVGGQLKQAGMQEAYEFALDATGNEPKRVATSQPSLTGTQTQTAQLSEETATQAKKASYEVRRFVNEQGNVIFITFKDGEPQQQIPMGYKEEGAGTMPVNQPATMVAAAPPSTSSLVDPTYQAPYIKTPTTSTTDNLTASLPAPTVMTAKRGGLAVKKTKEKKSTSSKGLAAKKK